MQEEYVNLGQQANGWDFEDEIGEFEEVEESWKNLGDNLGFSPENFFLLFIFVIVIALGIFLYLTRKRQMDRPIDSQVSKYKSLSASYK